VGIPEIQDYSGGFKHVTEVCDDQFWILVLQNILCDFADSHSKGRCRFNLEDDYG
jgi:hypothetical protein